MNKNPEPLKLIITQVQNGYFIREDDPSCAQTYRSSRQWVARNVEDLKAVIEFLAFESTPLRDVA